MLDSPAAKQVLRAIRAYGALAVCAEGSAGLERGERVRPSQRVTQQACTASVESGAAS